MTPNQTKSSSESGTGIRSITSYAEKPMENGKACCETDCCNTVEFAAAEEVNRNELSQLLRENKLPADDLPSSLMGFFTAVEMQAVVGVIGVEKYGNYGLLRSMVVDPAKRNKNIAGRLVEKAEEFSRKNNLSRIYLLTETAEQFFVRKGYSVISRNEVPVEIQQSSEFSHVCPKSAVIMLKHLYQ